jgi:hypothetical protein
MCGIDSAMTAYVLTFARPSRDPSRPPASPDGDDDADDDAAPSSHVSEVVAIRRPADYASTARIMANLATEHAAEGDLDTARSFANDAALLLGPVDPSRSPEAANAFLAIGHAMLTVSEAHRARAAFEDAALGFEARGEQSAAAHARLGLASALLSLHDPTARIALEDAGAVFEDLGDVAMVEAVELAIRDAEARFQTSPRSFATCYLAPRRAAR